MFLIESGSIRERYVMLCCFGFGMMLMSVTGCSRGPKRAAAPKWDPSGMSSSAMEFGDADGDGFISDNELDAMPGLKAAMDVLDVNGDSKASPDEISDLIEKYAQSRIGLTSETLTFKRKGRALKGATVRMVPEPFLNGVIEAAEGVTNELGSASMSIPGQPSPLLKPGLYRIEVSSEESPIPDKYNTSTELGIAVSAVSDSGYGSPPVYDLK